MNLTFYFDYFQGYERHSKLPNFYSILQVERSSSALDIRQSYKKISKKLHPDKNDSPNAEIEFQRVKLAYDVCISDIYLKYNYFFEISYILYILKGING